MTGRVMLYLLPVVLLAFAGGALFGRTWLWSDVFEETENVMSLRSELNALKAREKEREGELAMLQTRTTVDRQSLELVRKEIAGYRRQVAESEEALRFYRSLMSPDAAGSPGLTLRAPEIVTGERPGQYRLRLIVQQEAREHELMQGALDVGIEGLMAGDPVRLPLAEVSARDVGDSFSLEFRYFQRIEILVQLPEGFEPQSVDVAASISKPRPTAFEQSFPWSVKDRFTYVGQ